MVKILFYYGDPAEGMRLANLLSQRSGLTVEISFSPKEFQEKFKSLIPEVVILDVVPQNLEILRKVNGLVREKFSSVKRFLLVTDPPDGNFFQWQKSEWAGDAYFPKPVDLDFLELVLSDFKKVKTKAFNPQP